MINNLDNYECTLFTTAQTLPVRAFSAPTFRDVLCIFLFIRGKLIQSVNITDLKFANSAIRYLTTSVFNKCLTRK